MTDDFNFKSEAPLGEMFDADREARLDRLLNRYSEAINRGKEYTNVIILGGYAAFFALWSTVAGDIGPAARCMAGGLLSVSALVFISWEVLQMYVHAQERSDFAAIIDFKGPYPSDFDRKWSALQAREYRRLAGLQKWWLTVLTISVATGLPGGAILAGAALARGFGV